LGDAGDHHLGARGGLPRFSIDPLAQMLRSRARVGEGAAISLAMAVMASPSSSSG
jgi:hypothetical protein